MTRNMLAVGLGYLAIIVAVFVLFTGAYLVLGAERAFEPASYRTSFSWCVASIILGVPAALFGGWVCSQISKSRKTVAALAATVVLLGFLMAIPTLHPRAQEGARPGNVPNMEAMRKAQTPPWVAFLNPVIGAAAVLQFARKRTVPRTSQAPEPAKV